MKGTAIPFSARILHVADVYDALTSLCLALAISPDTVNTELVRQSGSRFDPEVVAAWLECSEGTALCS
jgi:HD-GYP domain-containing protein (c-di-GMP phosphodiesterase class II)